MTRERAKNLGALAAFVLCCAMTAYYLIAGYGAYLDSDMASELALARHLCDEGALISDTWRYSTEVRVLSTQLVFTPLMALFGNDWRLVRTLGCLILLTLMAASCYGCARALGARQRYALLFSGLTICAPSVVYSQMVIIGAYYIPHAVLTNACVALCALCLRRGGKHLAAPLCALLALCAVMGASSIRYLLCAALPVAMAGAWAYIFPSGDERLPRTPEQTRAAVIPVAACASAVAGYAVGQRLLAALCLSGGGRYGGSRLQAISGVDLFAALREALCGLVKLMGFAEGSLLLSAHGLISVGALALLPLCAMLLVRCLRDTRRAGRPVTRFGALTLAMSAGLSLFTFVMVEGLYLNRYWIPMMTLGAPVMAACLTAEQNPVLRRVGALALACVTLLTSAAQIRASMGNPEIGASRLTAARQVEETGLTLGYATFWNANVLTELTDGRVEVVAMGIDEGGVPTLDEWLESEENAGENRPDEPVFLLLEAGERERLSDFLALCGGEERVLADGRVLARVSSQRAFFDAMRALAAR